MTKFKSFFFSDDVIFFWLILNLTKNKYQFYQLNDSFLIEKHNWWATITIFYKITDCGNAATHNYKIIHNRVLKSSQPDTLPKIHILMSTHWNNVAGKWVWLKIFSTPLYMPTHTQTHTQSLQTPPTELAVPARL